MQRIRTLTFFSTPILLMLLLLPAAPMAAEEVTARGLISRCEDGVHAGFIQLQERPSEEGVKQVDVFIRALGLPAGKHAVHIHETGVCDPCGGANGHFDPGPNSNPSPDGNHPFHSGDLINLEINERGAGTLFTTTSRLTLSEGPLSIFDEDGAAVIIHVDPDSYCPEGEAAGCAGGARLACGIIRRQ